MGSFPGLSMSSVTLDPSRQPVAKAECDPSYMGGQSRPRLVCLWARYHAMAGRSGGLIRSRLSSEKLS
jgi:hypothetical protein